MFYFTISGLRVKKGNNLEGRKRINFFHIFVKYNDVMYVKLLFTPKNVIFIITKFSSIENFHHILTQYNPQPPNSEANMLTTALWGGQMVILCKDCSSIYYQYEAYVCFKVNWDWSAVQVEKTNQKRMYQMAHSFCFHPALSMLPLHHSPISTSKCICISFIVWLGKKYTSI